MRNSILGFNQADLVKNGLDLTDALLLNYIYISCSSPSMKKTHDEEDQPYVWLQHKKILEDIPIIGIGEDMLKKRLHKLNEAGFIKSVIKSSDTRGRKTYYTITVKCEDMLYTNQVESITLDNTRPSVMNYPSDNKIISDNKLKDNSTNVELGQATPTRKHLITVNDSLNTESKPKKKSRYEQCVEVIDDMIDPQYVDLKNILTDYLTMRLAIKDKPMYVSGWKALVKKLCELSQDAGERYKIVRQSLENSWATFYPLKQYSKKTGQDKSVFSEYGTVKTGNSGKGVLANVQF